MTSTAAIYINPNFNYLKYNKWMQAREKMQRRKLTKIRPLKAHLLRVREDETYPTNINPYPNPPMIAYNFTYLQRGQQWECGVYAKDELDAYIKIKRGLRAGNYYLGREYYTPTL